MIERQSRAADWERIAPRIAGAGNATTARHYQYRDETAEAGRTYRYRLIAVNSTGTAQEIASREVIVHAAANMISEYRLYPELSESL